MSLSNVMLARDQLMDSYHAKKNLESSILYTDTHKTNRDTNTLSQVTTDIFSGIGSLGHWKKQ
jgi:hypothetical protein